MMPTRAACFEADQTITLLLTTIGIWLVGAVPSTLMAEEKKLVREAGIHYQKTCMACHVPPDLRFATDRAWLGQIRETD